MHHNLTPPLSMPFYLYQSSYSYPETEPNRSGLVRDRTGQKEYRITCQNQTSTIPATTQGTMAFLLSCSPSNPSSLLRTLYLDPIIRPSIVYHPFMDIHEGVRPARRQMPTRRIRKKKNKTVKKVIHHSPQKYAGKPFQNPILSLQK
jgi:hypothetical protein